MPPKIKKVTREGENFHVRFRPPAQFTRIRTPAWAARVADSISKRAKVRMGRTSAGNWFVQSVLIEQSGGKSKRDARRLARRIVKEIED